MVKCTSLTLLHDKTSIICLISVNRSNFKPVSSVVLNVKVVLCSFSAFRHLAQLSVY